MASLCAVQNHLDRDPGPEAADYACGALTYDGHKGTDIRVPDLPAMAAGVAVVAAAPGRVRAVRDGMADIDVREAGPSSVEGREAGNGVLIDHGGGWESQYSHLRRGSVTVAPGDRVASGDRLGLIGMSGNAAFPHVHFEVRFEGRPVDPFVGLGATGLEAEPDCGPGRRPLWTPDALETLAYRPTGLLAAGFATGQPTWPAARRGDYRAATLRRDSAALVFWVSLYGVRRGDRQEARLIAPDGSVVAEAVKTLDGPKAQWFSFLGRKRRGASWPAGSYRAKYRLTRQVNGEAREVVALGRRIELR